MRKIILFIVMLVLASSMVVGDPVANPCAGGGVVDEHETGHGEIGCEIWCKGRCTAVAGPACDRFPVLSYNHITDDCWCQSCQSDCEDGTDYRVCSLLSEVPDGYTEDYSGNDACIVPQFCFVESDSTTTTGFPTTLTTNEGVPELSNNYFVVVIAIIAIIAIAFVLLKKK